MADKQQFLDVWIVDTNTVYKQVPFTVVTDWLQQGRLLEGDCVKPTGTKDWYHIRDVPGLAAFLPRVEPFRAEDRAEALEPVAVDFSWRPRHDDEEDDVDMIPLIDVSLVLLIFFMMTATVAAAGGLISTPEAKFGSEITSDPRMVWIGIERSASDGKPVYSIGQADRGAAAEDQKLTEAEVLQRLDGRLKNGEPVEVSIRADGKLPYETVKQLHVALEYRRGRGAGKGIQKIHAEVSERDVR
jgi:biopolymer transport protein ExbD